MYTGVASISGTWVSTATGGSTSNFTCLDTTLTWTNDLALAGTMPAVSWDDLFSIAGGSNVTGAFTGTFDQLALGGTQVETIDTSSGSASVAISLPRQ